LNFLFFIAVKILKMKEFTNFENFDLLNYIFSDENDLPVLPAEDTEPDTTRLATSRPRDTTSGYI
jgi:hypothetical protein